MKKNKILIIGGGLAGLGCALELSKQGELDFLVLAKDIGGRAPDSSKVPPRATFYARTEYRNLYPFLKLGRKANVWKGRLVGKDKIWKPIKICLRHPLASLRFYFHVRKFNKHYERFALRSETVTQKQAFEEDAFILKLYTQSAIDYLRENNLTILQEELVGTLVRVTGFLRIQEANAFLMLWIWLNLVKNGQECTVNFNKLTESFSDKILTEEVSSVENLGNRWQVKVDSGEIYESEILVVATPINISQKLLSVQLAEFNVVKVYSVTVKGKVREKYSSGRYNVLPAQENDVVVVKNDDSTFIFCSTQPNYDLTRYFEEFEIIETRNWDPAGFFGKSLIDSKQDNNLYVIGDYHFPGLEAAFVTGIQTARSILSNRA